MDRAGSPS